MHFRNDKRDSGGLAGCQRSLTKTLSVTSRIIQPWDSIKNDENLLKKHAFRLFPETLSALGIRLSIAFQAAFKNSINSLRNSLTFLSCSRSFWGLTWPVSHDKLTATLKVEQLRPVLFRASTSPHGPFFRNLVTSIAVRD